MLDNEQTFSLLSEVYAEDVLLRAAVFEWHSEAFKRTEGCKDDEMTRPSGTDKNCCKYWKVEGSCVNRSSLGVTVVNEEPNMDKKKDETNFDNKL